MEWLTIQTYEYKKQAKSCWHHWFAWHPVTVKIYPDGAKTRVWFINILRKGTLICNRGESMWKYEYKFNNNPTHY